MNYRKTEKYSLRPWNSCSANSSSRYRNLHIEGVVKLKINRLTINQYPEGVEVIISARRSPFVNFFLLVWMIGWSLGEIEIIGNFLNYEGETPDAFMVFWACGWTLSGLLAVFIWLWNVKGREIVRISDRELVRSREYVFFSRSNKYTTELISDLRLTDNSPYALEMSGGMEFWGLSGGMISFNYGPAIYKFGLGIDETEATRIIETIKVRFESL